MPPKARSRVLRPVAMVVLVVAAVAAAWFALRTYSSFRLLQSAQAVGQPHVSSLRAWMTLRYVADLTFGEIGESLGLPENTVKTHFQRAKGMLRAKLQELAPGRE